MKRNYVLLLGVLLLISFTISSCWLVESVHGDGQVKEEVRILGAFDQIEVSRGMNVYITQGSPQKIVVVADNNLHEIIRTEVHGHILKVYAEKNIRDAEEKKVMITVENLNEVRASSGANIWSQAKIVSEDMYLEASSGANLTLEVEVKNLDARSSSGANVNLSGTANKSEMDASSGANIFGEKLKSGKSKMQASSGSNVSSAVLEKLEARASSGGNVYYYGEPTSTEVKSSSGGNIIRK